MNQRQTILLIWTTHLTASAFGKGDDRCNAQTNTASEMFRKTRSPANHCFDVPDLPGAVRWDNGTRISETTVECHVSRTRWSGRGEVFSCPEFTWPYDAIRTDMDGVARFTL